MSRIDRLLSDESPLKEETEMPAGQGYDRLLEFTKGDCTRMTDVNFKRLLECMSGEFALNWMPFACRPRSRPVHSWVSAAGYANETQHNTYETDCLRVEFWNNGISVISLLPDREIIFESHPGSYRPGPWWGRVAEFLKGTLQAQIQYKAEQEREAVEYEQQQRNKWLEKAARFPQ